MKIGYFVKIALPYSENQVNNFEKLVEIQIPLPRKPLIKFYQNSLFCSNSPSLLRKSSQQFREIYNRLRSLDPEKP